MKKLKLLFIGMLAGIFATISILMQRKSIKAMARDKAEWMPKDGDVTPGKIVRVQKKTYRKVLKTEEKKLKTESKAHIIAEFKERFQ